MPKLLFVERDGAVLPGSAPKPWPRPTDVLVRKRLSDSQFWRFLLQFCEQLGVPAPPRPKRQAG
jgi:hypothetical protein